MRRQDLLKVSFVFEFVYIGDCFVVIPIKSIETFFVKLHINIRNRWLGSPKSLRLALVVIILGCCGSMNSEARQILVTLGLRGQDFPRLLLRSPSYTRGSREVMGDLANLNMRVEMESVGIGVIIITGARGKGLVLEDS